MRGGAPGLHALLTFAAVLGGAAVVATRVAVQDVPPISLAVLRYGQGALLLGLCLAALAPARLRVRWRDVPLLVLLGAILFAALPLAFNAGLRLTTASRGSLMLATVPAWTALLARAAGQERLTRRQGVGLALAIAGVAAAVAEYAFAADADPAVVVGDALVLVAALCGGAYGVLVKRAYARYSALTVTAYGMLAGTLLLLPAAVGEGLPAAVAGMDGETVMLVGFLGVFGGAVLWYAFAFGLTKLTPTQVAVYVNLNPLAAMVLGAALLGERVSTTTIAGFGMVVAGVVLMNWPRRFRT